MSMSDANPGLTAVPAAPVPVPVNVTDLVPGDQVPTVRTVTKVERSAMAVVVSFDDGTVTTYDLSGGTNPAVELYG